MSNYPASKDDLKVDTAGTDEMSAHAELHNDANEAINAIQDFIGTSDNGGGTTIVDGINIISGHVEAIEAALGVTINIDADGNVTITPNGEDPIIPIPSDDSKFDVGAGTTNLNDATAMEAAIGENATNIENVISGLGGTVNPDGSIDIDVDTSDKFDKGATSYADAKEMQDAIEANEDAITSINENGLYDDTELIKRLEGDEGILEDHEKRLEAEENHKHDDLAAGDHNHDGDYAADDHDHDLVYQPKGDYATEDHTHDDLSAGDHTHDSDDTKLDKSTTKYVDAKAIEDDIDGIAQSISELSENYDQIVIDLGDAGKDLTVELGNYLKKGTASYADAAGIEADIDQEKQDRAEADTALNEEVAKKLDKGTSTYTDAQDIQDAIEGIVVPEVDDFVTTDDLATALEDKADETHTHNDLAAGDHEHDGVYAEEDHTHDEYLTDLTHDHDSTYQPVGDYATTEELTEGLAGKSDSLHTHDTTHNHEEYFLSGAEKDEFGQPIPLPYANAKLLGDAVDTKADEDHTHEGTVSFAVNANDENLFCNKIVTLTQAEYDSLDGNRDPNTLYLAVDA